MARSNDLQDAAAFLRRIASRVNALQDRGRPLAENRRLFELQHPGRWDMVIILSHDVTAGEVVTLAEILGTTTTWLLTGRHPQHRR